MTYVEDKIADIIYENDLTTAASILHEIMRECKNHPVDAAIDMVCERQFG